MEQQQQQGRRTYDSARVSTVAVCIRWWCPSRCLFLRIVCSSVSPRKTPQNFSKARHKAGENPYDQKKRGDAFQTHTKMRVRCPLLLSIFFQLPRKSPSVKQRSSRLFLGCLVVSCRRGGGCGLLLVERRLRGGAYPAVGACLLLGRVLDESWTHYSTTT